MVARHFRWSRVAVGQYRNLRRGCLHGGAADRRNRPAHGARNKENSALCRQSGSDPKRLTPSFLLPNCYVILVVVAINQFVAIEPDERPKVSVEETIAFYRDQRDGETRCRIV